MAVSHQPAIRLVSALGALGVVFGDIGTSPLYTMKTVLTLAGGSTTPATVFGLLSLLVWTLVIITTVKYAGFAMRIDNEGEGGILALMALLGLKRAPRPLIVAAGLFGAALIYGDGAVTPAISVLSALEGLNTVAPGLQPYVLPLAVLILFGLFALQPLGTAAIGRAFGPIMLLWFLIIAALGVRGILQHPSVLTALNPMYAVHFLTHSGYAGFLVLGGIFLCVTGAEALYADMGHFGAGPIRLAWGALVFPSLVLNYAGQGAVLLSVSTPPDNVFFSLCPPAWRLPLVLLSTVATIIASQSIITGAFSMTRQAIHLGWMPRLRIVQTSQEGFGQIYVSAVNWGLMVVTIALALGFKKSDNLAAAYGIAVSATMLMTTGLLYIAMREVWRWSLAAAGAVALLFGVVDSAFLASNLTKFAEGGYVPVALALMIYGVMAIWHAGATSLARRIDEHVLPVADFMATLPGLGVLRPPGTAVFLTRSKIGLPLVIRWYTERTGALHAHVVTVTLDVESRPWVADGERFTLTRPAPDFLMVRARYGFMERPDVPRLLAQLAEQGEPVDPAKVLYFSGLERVVAGDGPGALPRWVEAIFSALVRNSVHTTDIMRIPPGQLMELGRQVSV